MLSTINKAPGVYIDESNRVNLIAGVATNIAAHSSEMRRRGPINTTPVRITSWDQFREVFGDAPVDGKFGTRCGVSSRTEERSVTSFEATGSTPGTRSRCRTGHRPTPGS